MLHVETDFLSQSGRYVMFHVETDFLSQSEKGLFSQRRSEKAHAQPCLLSH